MECCLDKGLSFSTDTDGDLGILGHIYCPILGQIKHYKNADLNLIQNIFCNSINNSWKHSGEGKLASVTDNIKGHFYTDYNTEQGIANVTLCPKIHYPEYIQASTKRRYISRDKRDR